MTLADSRGCTYSPLYSEGADLPAIIGVKAPGEEHETAYVARSQLDDCRRENANLVNLMADGAERMEELESLARDMRKVMLANPVERAKWKDIPERFKALGLE